MVGGIYIAKPEKAFLDLAYFASQENLLWI